jgi:hypothetical protein
LGTRIPSARAQSVALAVGALTLLTGHFLPWAAHFTAALTRSAHELSVMTNFTPGAGVFWNEWFLLPLWASALLVALLAGKRWPGLGLSWLVASLGLPGYPHLLTAYANPDYRLQFFITLGVIGAAAGLSLAGSVLSAALRLGIIFACALASATPLAGYFVIKPAVEALYQDEIGIGLGWWLTLAGVSLLLFQVLKSCLEVMRAQHRREIRHTRP